MKHSILLCAGRQEFPDVMETGPFKTRYEWRPRMPKYKTSEFQLLWGRYTSYGLVLLLWILSAPKRVKPRVNSLSCKCIGFKDSALGQDQLNNQIPDRSILKATNIKVSLTGPRQTAWHHRFFVPLYLQSDLQDLCRQSVRCTIPGGISPDIISPVVFCKKLNVFSSRSDYWFSLLTEKKI